MVGFGVNALDLIAVIDGFPEPDTKAQFREFDVQGGGMTATAMVACARLGLRARYIGKIGADLWSRLRSATLSQEGVDVRGVIRVKDSPGHVSLVLADRGTGQRTLFFRRPAAYAINPAELDRTLSRRVGCCTWTASMPTRRCGPSTGPATAGMRITMDGERIVPGIEHVWPRVDLLVCNPRFLAAVDRQHRAGGRTARAGGAGPSRVAVTLAEHGVLALTDGRFIRVPGFPVVPVDTNGAGDVFHGACAVGELRSWPFEWTLTFANAVAAMKCRALGGRAGIPNLGEVVRFLADRGHGDIARALEEPATVSPRR